jgi:hypothetical protein
MRAREVSWATSDSSWRMSPFSFNCSAWAVWVLKPLLVAALF